MDNRGQEDGEVDQTVVSALQGQRGAVAIGVRLSDRMDARRVVASGEADFKTGTGGSGQESDSARRAVVFRALVDKTASLLQLP